MKLLTRICIILAMVTISNTALAIDTTPVQGKNVWTIGIDVKEIFISPVGEYKTILHANKLATTVYLAYRTQGTFGFEFGYTTSDKRGKDLFTNVGTEAFGATATTEQINTATVQLDETYFDIFAHARLINRVEAKLGIGIGYSIPRFRFYTSSSDDDPVSIALRELRGMGSVNVRLLAGMQGLVTERIGLRALISYENLSTVRVAGSYQKLNRQMYGNAYCIAAGIYFNFYGQEEFEPL